MKDFIGQEVNVGDYFAYPTTIGRSASMNIYQLKEVKDNGNVRARPLDRSYGANPFKYEVREYEQTGDGWQVTKRPMTDKEREKVDNKCSTLKMFTERALLLKDFKETYV